MTAPRAPAALPRTVVVLGLVSLLTDLSSEMIVPLLPAFAAALGAGPAFLGALEGVAQAIVAGLKLAAGWLSDRGRRKPWILLGYGISSLARPLMAIVQTPLAMLVVRGADRVGKGLRSSPRDALIADVCPAALRGRAYGLQRAMDHSGAVLGPLVAFALLQGLGFDLRAVFAAAALPALASLLLLGLAVREAPRQHAERAGGSTAALPPVLRGYLAAVGFATLSTMPELLLVQRAQDLGVPTRSVLLLWAALHAVRAALATPLGAASDRFGRRGVLLLGQIANALVLAGFAAASAPWHAFALFALHGLHAAFTEGAERALIADLAGPQAKGRAFAWFHVVTGLTALPGMAALGWVYEEHGAGSAFAAAAGASVVAGGLLWASTGGMRRPHDGGHTGATEAGKTARSRLTR